MNLSLLCRILPKTLPKTNYISTRRFTDAYERERLKAKGLKPPPRGQNSNTTSQQTQNSQSPQHQQSQPSQQSNQNPFQQAKNQFQQAKEQFQRQQVQKQSERHQTEQQQKQNTFTEYTNFQDYRDANRQTGGINDNSTFLRVQDLTLRMEQHLLNFHAKSPMIVVGLLVPFALFSPMMLPLNACLFYAMHKFNRVPAHYLWEKGQEIQRKHGPHGEKYALAVPIVIFQIILLTLV